MANRGKFFWYELMTSDPEAAQAFYVEVVGWRAEAAKGLGDMPYTMFHAGGVPHAGMFRLDDEALANGARPQWAGYIGVDDVDAAVAQVQADGGRQYSAPMDIANVGRFSMVADPQGAAIVLFKPEDTGMPPSRIDWEAQHTAWHELFTPNSEAALAWYGKTFGWALDQEMDMGEHGKYRIFKVGDGPMIGGMMDKPEQMPMPMWVYYFGVDGIDAAADRVAAGGGKVAMGPMQVPGGSWVLQAFDPQGALFGLLSPTR